ncbi:metallophosphoesterase family protein [Sporolactobacillus sp. KGMB 08714]|uniref:metallophosphoesterase family protein n=1 Tax=Sporolactobacillus sp. KGMB 08714 TaxID=3064704 RepID=UPI002FBEFABB
MLHKIALLADVHGNTTALEAVVADAFREGATEYWFLGDLIIPGPGSANLLAILKKLKVSVFVRGNWEDCFLDALNGHIDLNDPTDVYIARQAQYQYEHLSSSEIAFMEGLPLYLTKQINGMKMGISHHLPDRNCGGDLATDQDQQNFDRLFSKDPSDLAVYAHIHHPIMRYSSADQLIINPGSIGQPFSNWTGHRPDLRPEYAIIEIDETGLLQTLFKRVSYDRNKEIQEAKRQHLPYFELYQELLMTGRIHTHDKQRLAEINRRYGYKKEVIEFLKKAPFNTRKR